MAKIIFIGLFILLFHRSFGQSVQSPCIDCIPCIYLDEIGTRESGGANRGTRVEEYLDSAGGKPGQPWCAAFVKWVFDKACIPTTINVYSPSAQNKKNLVWYKKKSYKSPVSGDVFCLYYPKLKRIGHTGFYHRAVNEKIYESVEGNSNDGGSREGIGVFKLKKRSLNATYSISRWTKS